MKPGCRLLALLIGLGMLGAGSFSVGSEAAEKIRFLQVDSYHREYRGSWAAMEGFFDALLRLGYLDNKDQVEELRKNDFVESETALIQHLWMDSKRKDTEPELIQATVELTEQIKAFQPTLLFLRADNATNYIGNQFLDATLPIVFYSVKNNPVKYGVVDSIERPGHNVTGVYVVGLYKESLELLKQLVPTAKTFAILADGTETSRSHLKAVEDLARQPDASLQLVGSVATKRFDEWKQKALELQEQVDAFYLAGLNNLEDVDGREVSREEVLQWYLAQIKRPEASHSKTYVELGVLCAADYSNYNQGVEAVMMAHEILTKELDPATYPTRTAGRGPLVVNRQRAQMLGLTLTPAMGIEEYVEEASVLKDQPATSGEQPKP